MTAETDLLYLSDAYQRTFEATVVAVDGARIALDRTAFYATGGGQPNDTGTLDIGGTVGQVTDVSKDAGVVWHVLAEPAACEVGQPVTGEIDWDRRHALMRTHTAMHILCGVIWNEWGVPVTGGSMQPLSARMDFEFDPLPERFKERVQEMVAAEIAADRPVTVEFLGRDRALVDAELIRTKTNLIPEGVTSVRVVDIVGLDKQADGGTHVASTKEVGSLQVTKTESKGKGFKRLRVQIGD